MAAVQVPGKVIELSDYIDTSKYTIYEGAHARLSSSYHVNSNTNISIVHDPGLSR